MDIMASYLLIVRAVDFEVGLRPAVIVTAVCDSTLIVVTVNSAVFLPAATTTEPGIIAI